MKEKIRLDWHKPTDDHHHTNMALGFSHVVVFGEEEKVLNWLPSMDEELIFALAAELA